MKKIFSTILLLFSIIGVACSQSEYQPYSYQFYQKLNGDLYSTHTNAHTSLKPLFVGDSLLRHHYDSLMNYGSDGQQHNWGHRKLFSEHLIDVRDSSSTFYADILPDFTVGENFSGSKNTNLTSLGFQLGGTAGSKFYYNISGFASQAVFPEYISSYINQTGIVASWAERANDISNLSNYINRVGIVPGQAYDQNLGHSTSQWSYVTAVLSYTPVKYLNITAGRDKTFIGDGYRSMLLSDYASPYPFFKLTATLGHVRYMAMWADMNDPASTSQYGINRKKFGVFHYLDWSVSNRISLGFFENVMGYFTDDNGQKRPFDFNYINPLIAMQPINNSSDNSDKSLLGFTAKYKISDGVTAYGQFALNEFHASDFFSSDGASDNKYGWQFGFRGTNLFAVKNLNFLIETNNAKPYTYSARSAIENYSDNGEPLAHPWGANFRELVGLLNYSYNRFDFSGEADFGRYGLDINGLNYGKDIFQLYPFPAATYPNGGTTFGNYMGQGLTTNLVYFEGKIAFLLNPKYNLRIEAGAIYRTENNSQFRDRTTWLTIGLRSSFREFYTDLASYKAR
ncbi:MAG TPA: gliding motility protein RemB [Mucilaginibacter sp.]|jgi:hypothetical protein